MSKSFGFIPMSLYDLTGIESWLMENAQHGLRPTHLGSFYRFATDGAPGARYCVVAKEDGKPAPMRDGWDYALPLGLLFQVYTTTDPSLAPLPKDFAALETRIAKALNRNLIFIAILCAMFLVPLFYTSKFDVQPNKLQDVYSLLFAFSRWDFVAFLIAFCASQWLERHETTRFLADQRRRKTGESVSPWKPRKWYRASTPLQICCVPLLILVVIASRWDWETPLKDFQKPYIALQSLEQVPLSAYQDLFGDDAPSHFLEPDYAKTHFSILATSYYEVIQTGYETDAEMTNTFGSQHKEGMVYSPDLEMTRMELTMPLFSRWVAETLLHGYRLVNLTWTYQDIPCEGTDFAILATIADGRYQLLALGQGRNVAVFRYSGEADLQDQLDILVKMVQ